MLFALLFTLFIDVLIYASHSFSFEIKDYILLSLLTFSCIYTVFKIGEKISIKEDKKVASEKRSIISDAVLIILLIVIIPFIVVCAALFVRVFAALFLS